MKLYPVLSDVIDVKGAEPVVDTEEHLLAVLTVPVEQNLVPDSSVETPEYPVPGVQPVGRVREVQFILLWLGEVARSVAVARHQVILTAAFLIISFRDLEGININFLGVREENNRTIVQ